MNPEGEVIELPIRPFICATQHALNNTNSNHLTEAPAKVDIRSEISTKRDWANFGGVCDGNYGHNISIPYWMLKSLAQLTRLKYSPWLTRH